MSLFTGCLGPVQYFRFEELFFFKYVEFCQQLAHVMKLDTIANELGIELNGDALLTRAEQLANLEQDSLTKRRVMTSALDRQLHDAKKHLESKEMQLDAMRKKMAHMETEASHRVSKCC